MNKALATFALVLALALPSAAQVSFGVMAGLNTTKLSLPTSLKALQLQAKEAQGWFAGPKVYASIPVAGLGIDAALLYNQRKAVAKLATTGEQITEHTLHSVAMPINLRYTLGLGSVAAVYVATGPQLDYNLGGKDWVTTLTTPTTFRTQTAEVSWNVGVGVRVLSHLEVGVGYNFGLDKTATIVNDLTGLHTKATTRTSSFSLQAVCIF